jgi:hypothetical protein
MVPQVLRYDTQITELCRYKTACVVANDQHRACRVALQNDMLALLHICVSLGLVRCDTINVGESPIPSQPFARIC